MAIFGSQDSYGMPAEQQALKARAMQNALQPPNGQPLPQGPAPIKAPPAPPAASGQMTPPAQGTPFQLPPGFQPWSEQHPEPAPPPAGGYGPMPDWMQKKPGLPVGGGVLGPHGTGHGKFPSGPPGQGGDPRARFPEIGGPDMSQRPNYPPYQVIKGPDGKYHGIGGPPAPTGPHPPFHDTMPRLLSPEESAAQQKQFEDLIKQYNPNGDQTWMPRIMQPGEPMPDLGGQDLGGINNDTLMKLLQGIGSQNPNAIQAMGQGQGQNPVMAALGGVRRMF